MTHDDSEKPQPNTLIYARRPDTDFVSARLRDAGCVVSFGDPAWEEPGSHEAAFAGAATGMIGLLGPSMRNAPMGRKLMLSSPELRVIAKMAVGVDDVDVDAATELGILVCHAPTEASTFSVSEGAVTLMLTLLKKIREREADVRAGKWLVRSYSATYVGRRAEDGYPGITIGLVGLGRIGARVAELLAPWGIRILGYDAYLTTERPGVERVDYETLLRESDLVSFHVALTEETQGMLSDRELALMKPTAYVVNTARGKVIDEAALVRALADNRIAGAALDAFEVEPLPLESPLRNFGHRVLLSPHATAMTGETSASGLRPASDWASRAVIAALKGEVPHCVYNKVVIPRWSERFGGIDLLAKS